MPKTIRQPSPWHSFWRWRYGYQVVCMHRSHHLRLPCFRWRTYDGQCGRHNTTCFFDCTRES